MKLDDLRAREMELVAQLEQVRLEIALELEGGPRVRVVLQRGLRSLMSTFTTAHLDGDDRVFAYRGGQGSEPAFYNSTEIWVKPEDAARLKEYSDSGRMFWVGQQR